MGGSAVTRISVEEYLALDRESEFKSEYHDGELFPIVAVSVDHGIISVNTSSRLLMELRSTPCRTMASPVRVRVSPSKFVYPDILVVCGKPVLTDEAADTVTNPKVIVEILSSSTGAYDYGPKFSFYRQLASFEEYLLIAQDAPRVEVFRRLPDNRWVLTPYEGLEAVVALESLGITLPLSEIYAGVEFASAS